MKKLTIQQVIILLPKIQEGMWQGEIKILSEDLAIPASLREQLKIGDSKMLVVYIGKEEGQPTYLAFVENEGGATFPLPFTPEEIPEESKLIVSPQGNIGFAKEEAVAKKVFITWENGKPQAKVMDTEQIIELADLPNEQITGIIQRFEQRASFEIKHFLFGNPNIFGYYPEGMEWAVNLVDPNTAKNSSPFSDNFFTENMTELREQILQAGPDATYQELDAIFETVRN